MSISMQERTAAIPSASKPRLAALTVAALGIVYGDIGTSPLYAFKESIRRRTRGRRLTRIVLGVLSMIFWAITLVVSLKYILVVLHAHNNGEGGILALLALVLRQLPSRGHSTRARQSLLGLFGAAMFYGDSVITPAISVLSAVEGLKVISPQLSDWVVPLTMVDSPRRCSPSSVSALHASGACSGRSWSLWFVVLGLLGAIADRP